MRHPTSLLLPTILSLGTLSTANFFEKASRPLQLSEEAARVRVLPAHYRFPLHETRPEVPLSQALRGCTLLGILSQFRALAQLYPHHVPQVAKHHSRDPGGSL